MHTHRKPLAMLVFTLASAMVLAVLASAAVAAQHEPSSASAKPPATVRVLACKSSSYYDGRELAFRAKIARQNAAVPQKLQVKVEVWRKLKESKRFRKLHVAGLGSWSTAKDPDATAFQSDINLKNIETAARYRAKAYFRWRDPATGFVQAHRVTRSKSCRQRKRLPRLRITKDSVVPMPGSSALTHRLTVVNKGGSEAIKVPVAVFADDSPAVFKTIDSIGPRQSVDVQIDVPACRNSAYAAVDPLRRLPRLSPSMRKPFQITRCR